MTRRPDYQRHNVSLYLGDCREILEEISADVVVSDPPYGIALRNGDVDGHRSQRSFGVAGDADQVIGNWICEWAESRKLPTILFASPWKPWPGDWRNLIVWDKGGGVGGGGDIQTCLKRTWELIQVARNAAMNGPRDDSVWRHVIGPSDTVDHICAKPVQLMERLINRFTNPGQLVVDPCLGSGSTGVACVRLARPFIGVEIDEPHFKTAVKRIDRALRDDRNSLFRAADLAAQNV